MTKDVLNRYVCPRPGQGAAEDKAALRPVLDPEQRLPGRGFYICDNAECQERGARYQGWRRKCKGVVKV